MTFEVYIFADGALFWKASQFFRRNNREIISKALGFKIVTWKITSFDAGKLWFWGLWLPFEDATLALSFVVSTPYRGAVTGNPRAVIWLLLNTCCRFDLRTNDGRNFACRCLTKSADDRMLLQRLFVLRPPLVRVPHTVREL